MKLQKFTFDVSSGKICVSDPCYSRGTWCGMFGVSAKNGKWVAEATLESIGSWGERVTSLVAYHSDYPTRPTLQGKDATFVAGVDSGCLGIFDDACYETAQDCFPRGAVSPVGKAGVVSSSGFGDGAYPVALFPSGTDSDIVRVEIEFITSDDLDEAVMDEEPALIEH